MNENSKTISFVILALVAVGLAVATRPKTPPITEDVVGRALAADFKDPLAAKSMEIIDYDTDTGTPKQFKVAQVKGVWSLPSHFDYPADAQEQLASAAASLMDLKILQLASDVPAEHPTFGVVDPATADAGAAGVGKHVILSDQGGKKLLDLIIGKEVKDNPKLHYVREPSKSPVYVVAVSTDKLTTRFDNWIEKDLLKLNTFDIARIFVNNYSIDVANRRQVPGDALDLTYNDKEAKWKLADLKEAEELDTTKLNEMKTALDDLKIVDVRKKPPGLSRDLKTEEGIKLDEQTMLSLNSKGYFPTQNGDLLSNEGEVVVGTNEGVQYVLRFGGIALGTEQAEEQKPDGAHGEKKDENKKEGEKKEQGANRYLFLMAQFDKELIAKPELEEVPGEAPAAAQPAAEPAASATDAAKPAAAPAPATPPAAETKPAAGAPAQPKPKQGPAAPDAQKPAEKKPDAKAAAAEKAPEPDITESDVLKEEAKEDAAAGKTPAEGSDAKQPGEAKAKTPQDIERIKAENKRKENDYNEKVKKGETKVKELNDRFADWYYVISDDIYKKIHLSRAEIMKKPEAEKEKGGPTEFDNLKKGIQAAGAAQVPPAPSAPAGKK